eukprot:TRINITY_DN47171_c0_g1_i1.p1 TRINITY_DN47171_c0_g1~~TRINITY_DN47171_c0_g1_i1.p1  ORF type:complete len:369 (+),score=79.09 TRINITY_DN47171_c0_g1_i1:93-1109(+)
MTAQGSTEDAPGEPRAVGEQAAAPAPQAGGDSPAPVAPLRGTARCIAPSGSRWRAALPEGLVPPSEVQSSEGEPIVNSDFEWCEQYLSPEVSHELPQGMHLHVKQAPVDEMHRADKNHTHGTVWRSSVVLAKWLLSQPPPPAGTRLVELGAGCGLASMAAARAGYCAEATDRPGCLDQATAAIADPRNSKQWAGNGTVSVVPLDWLDRSSYCAPAPVVVGCDLIYTRQYHVPVLQALRELVQRPDGRALIATQVRHPLREQPFWQMALGSFTIHEVDTSGVELTAAERNFIYVRELRPRQNPAATICPPRAPLLQQPREQQQDGAPQVTGAKRVRSQQ